MLNIILRKLPSHHGQFFVMDNLFLQVLFLHPFLVSKYIKIHLKVIEKQ